MSPAKSIPVAELAKLICELGTWVLNEACRQARQWQDAGLTDLVVAVNVSPVQFRRDAIEHEVESALAQHRLKASALELEITESLLVADSSHLSEVLARLHALGVHLAIDDFGTGYSNLGYLKRFKLERLKIDQSIVRQLLKNPHDQGIVRAMIEMAHCLDIQVVAEGIEDAATLQRLLGEHDQLP